MKRVLIYVFAVFALSSLLMSCDKDENTPDPSVLGTPELRLADTSATSVTVEWDAVENAASYEYTVNDGEPQPVTETSVQISTPEAGTYTVKVRALPEEGSEEFQPSDWAFATFTIE